MATGDLKNNLRKFHAELKLINYVCALDIEGLSIGRPSAFLPVLHFVLTEFSVELAQYFYSKDYEVLGKNDKNFLSVTYRILRDEFNTKPPLTKEQFFTLGFAERKLQFATSVIQLCRKKEGAMKPKKKKNMLGSSTAKTSKNSIPGGSARTTLGTKISTGSVNSQTTSLVAMLTESSASQNFSKPGINKTAVLKENDKCQRPGNLRAYKLDNPLSDGQKLTNDLNLTMLNDGCVSNEQTDDVRPRIIRASYFPKVDKNIGSSSVLSIPEKLTRINPLLQLETHWDSSVDESPSNGYKNVFVTKENICPNACNGLPEGYNNMDTFISCHSKSGQSQSSMLSPIPVTNKAHNMPFLPQSKQPIRNDCPRANDMTLEHYPERPDCSKHIFVTQPNERARNPVGNQTLDISLVDNHSPEFAEILDLVKEQDKKIHALEKEAEKQSNRIEEMMETNSKLNARVMVLETVVALIQEKMEP